VHERLVRAWLELEAWPDVAPALRTLKEKGIRLAPLSNFSSGILARAVSKSGLDGTFEHLLSTDLARTFKPDPRAYRLGADAFNLPREKVLFVAFASWDAAGAKWFGYPTFWLNRAGAVPDELSVEVDGAGKAMSNLVAFVERS
jgi:2-haloacid dehalogenase